MIKMEKEMNDGTPNKKKSRKAEKNDLGPLVGLLLQPENCHSCDASKDGYNSEDGNHQGERFCTVSSDTPMDGKRELVTNVTQMRDKARKNENGVSEDLSKTWTECGPETCNLRDELYDNFPYIEEQLQIGNKVLLDKSQTGKLKVQIIRPFNYGESCVNKVVVPTSAKEMSDAKEALLTHVDIIRESNLPKGVVFDSSKVRPILGKYMAGHEYEVGIKLGEGEDGKVTRTTDNILLTSSARKTIPISAFHTEEVRALSLLSGTTVSSDLYAAMIGEDGVDIFLEEIKEIRLSKIITEINSSEKMKSLFVQEKAKFMRYLPYAVLKALFGFHDKKICHNDFNWGNIFLDLQADFIAKIIDCGDAICYQEELEVTLVCQEYNQLCLLCLDMFHVDILDDYYITYLEDKLPKLENVDDITTREEIVDLIRKVSNIRSLHDVADFRQFVEKKYHQVREDTIQAVKNICFTAAGFHCTHDSMSLKGHDTNAKITPEHMNYARLCVALVTVCRNALSDILLTQVPAPHTNIYQALLANQANLTTRRHVRPGHWQNALLNQDQIQLVFPGNQGHRTGTVDQFDLSLLYTLIRNVSTVTAPLTGWGNYPQDQPRDTSLGASVERIRSYRNHISGHSMGGKLSQQDLENYWNKIRVVLDDIEAVTGRQVYSTELEKQKRQVINVYEAS